MFSRIITKGLNKRGYCTNHVPVNRVFSGIQPTGDLHLGNYLGAVVNWVHFQNKYPGKTMFCVVDLHSLTTKENRKGLLENTLEMTAVLLACGIDPKQSLLYNQSKVPAHSELAWILSCITPMWKLNTMIQFKEKVQKEGEAHAGLLNYPVLMAADILLFRSTHVPVGEDQTQHLELARNLASRANREWNNPDLFVVPTPIYTSQKRVMSLGDGKKKMSKSDPSKYSKLCLTDTKDDIAIKIKKAKTDIHANVDFNPEERPEMANLIQIFSALSNRSVESIVDEYKTKSIIEFKNALTDVVVAHVCPIGEKIAQYRSNKDYILSVLKEGSDQANEIAYKQMQLVKDALGLI
eukprot:TRINITY_DN12317_c0_g1_i1.p1 TRINITY_DN12317_c0_g1~~TRINITY_DN12317_c0_g1_i1.p1  ORF type:complete len:351 (-),score=62.28 TRINITY_DN12317_c0_g1_i1:65-1117(-)